MIDKDDTPTDLTRWRKRRDGAPRRSEAEHEFGWSVRVVRSVEFRVDGAASARTELPKGRAGRATGVARAVGAVAVAVSALVAAVEAVSRLL
jgi:hypothetical protein